MLPKPFIMACLNNLTCQYNFATFTSLRACLPHTQRWHRPFDCAASTASTTRSLPPLPSALSIQLCHRHSCSSKGQGLLRKTATAIAAGTASAGLFTPLASYLWFPWRRRRQCSGSAAAENVCMPTAFSTRAGVESCSNYLQPQLITGTACMRTCAGDRPAGRLVGGELDASALWLQL